MTNRSPTSRSLEYLRKQGYLVDVVERRLARYVTKDCFGCFDLLATKPGEVLGIQVTDRTNFSHRVTKIRALDNFKALQASPIEIRVHGWGLMASGKYELREEVIVP